MKNYKAVFFDWDGTAVTSRTADSKAVTTAMGNLLDKGICLIIVSGTTYDNICGGALHKQFSPAQLSHLYLGLGRGNHCFGFSPQAELVPLQDLTPSMEDLLKLHEVCFHLHARLLSRYQLPTDIVFSRDNYCKIDLMVNNTRNQDALYMQKDEISRIENLLAEHQIDGGLLALLQLAKDVGTEHGLSIQCTTDAKYLEVGYTTKSDNITWFMQYFKERSIGVEDCCFWGDEFGAITPGIWGSDSQMITPASKGGDFFSVSDIQLPLPDGVVKVGGGIPSFLHFLGELGKEEHHAS